MRSVAVALVLLLPLLGGAVAEEPLFSDPSGDAELRADNGGGALPGIPAGNAAPAEASDLLKLSALETDETIAFTIGVVGLDADPVSTVLHLDFGWGGEPFLLEIAYMRSSYFGGDARAWASLFKVEEESWQWIARLAPPAIGVDAGTLTAEVPKVYLVSSDERVPGRGDVIEVRSVRSEGGVFGLPFANVDARDRMPDGEGTPATLTLARGDFAQGHVDVRAPDPVRVSNGGATTFVFRALLRNTATTEDEFILGVADVPEGWNASVRSPLRVPPQTERTVSILVSVPFEHVHGGYSSFNLTVQSTTDPATQARMRMGVLHTPIPQPAGHHSELFLHARERDLGPVSPLVNGAFPMAWGWMNTDADREGEAAFLTPESGTDGVEFRIPLDPMLKLGLDFDLDRLGSLEGTILGKRDDDVKIGARLQYVYGRGDERGQIRLASFENKTIALDQQDATPFRLALTPTNESDYIPYRPDGNLVLTIHMDAGPSDSIRYASALDAQLLTEGFVLHLPLNEYHDRLSGAAEAAEALEIVARGPVEKAGLPGSVMTYPFTVRNGGPGDVFVLDLAGNDAREGVLVPRGEIALAQGASREVTLAVEIPIGANPDEEFEVLLFVHARDDPSKMAIARTKTRATLSAEQASPDESGLLLDAHARESQVPWPGALALLAIALAATSLPTKASRSRPPRR